MKATERPGEIESERDRENQQTERQTDRLKGRQV